MPELETDYPTILPIYVEALKDLTTTQSISIEPEPGEEVGEIISYVKDAADLLGLSINTRKKKKNKNFTIEVNLDT